MNKIQPSSLKQKKVKKEKKTSLLTSAKELKIGKVEESSALLWATEKPLGLQEEPLIRKERILQRKRRRWMHPLHQLRLQKGYTLEELAKLVNLSPSYLSRLESGRRRLHADNIERLALALSCSPKALLSCLGKDLPLYVIKDSAKASFYFDKPTEWVLRPQELAEVKSAFAFSIVSPFLSSRYRPGDLIFVHPQRLLSLPCSVLIITSKDELYVGDLTRCLFTKDSKKPESFIFKYCEYQANGYKEREISFYRKDIKYMYRIIGFMEAPLSSDIETEKV